MTRSLRNRVRLFVSPLEDRVTPTAGALDRSFGTNGTVADTALAGLRANSIVGVASATDGSVYVLGTVSAGSGGSGDQTADFGVVKLTAAGVVDPTFGVAGLATVGFNLQTNNGMGPDIPQSIVVRPDGKIVVAGRAMTLASATPASLNREAVALLTTAGTLDTGFNATGTVAFDFPTPNIFSSSSTTATVGVTSSNDIVLAVNPNGFDSQTGINSTKIVSVRLTPVGAFDTNYDADGRAETVVVPGKNLTLRGLAVAPDGAVYGTYPLEAGEAMDLYGLRIAATGTRDMAFGTAGAALLGNTGTSAQRRTLLPAADGSFVLVSGDDGTSPTNTTVSRFKSDGTPDTAFGTAGVFAQKGFASGTANSAYTDSTGRVVVGLGSSFSTAGLFRLTAAGAADSTFGKAGFAAFPQFSSVPSIVPTADGHVLSRGSSAVTRYDGDDSLNTAPIVTGLVAVTVPLNSGGPRIDFTVGDNETPGTLVLTATSSNPALVPNTTSGLSVYYFNSGGTPPATATATLTVSPAFGQTGTTTITVTATDALGAATSQSFLLTVTGPNSPPTVTAITNQATTTAVAKTVTFTVGDATTPAADLVVTATSSNGTLVPAAGLVLGGTGANRTLTVTPAAGQTGTATITVTVTDAGSAFSTRAFNLAVTTLVANTPPTIAAVANQVTTAGVATVPLPLAVGDAETAAESLVVTVTSSNEGLVPAAGVVIGGVGSARTVTVTPAAGQTGTATITLAVTDAGSLSATTTFTYTVNPAVVPESAPTISPAGDLVVTTNTALPVVAFTVGDAQTAPAALVVFATSSNLALVPAAGLVLGGTGAARTLALTHTPDQSGVTTITLTVTDAIGLSTTTTFTLIVNPAVVVPPVNTHPTISAPLGDQTVGFGLTSSVPVVVTDAETLAALLVVTATSSNLTLVPNANLTTGGGVVRATPAAGQSGATVITVTVTDAGGLTASTQYTLTVQPEVVVPPVNRAPTIGRVANQTVTAGNLVGPLFFGVDDADTGSESVTVAAGSSNLALVPLSGVVFGFGGGIRTVTVTPAAGQTGSATITMTATDLGGLTATTTFTVTVTPALPKVALVGVPNTVVGGTDGTFRVVTPDGKAGAAVAAFPGFTGSVRVASADYNGDGVPDTVAGTGPGQATRVRVLDGKSGAELFALDPFEASFTGGVFVSAGDVNGDGVPDLIVSPDEGGGPRVRVFSGKGFAQVADFFGIDDPAFRGGARTATGDLNGDGVADLVVAAGFGGGPRVAVFDGTSGDGSGYTRKLLADFFAFEKELTNGLFPAVGDLDGDGRADFLAGAGPGGGPRVVAFAGRDLVATPSVPTRLADFFAGDPARRDGVRVTVKDLDGDARADVVAAVGPTVLAYSGKNLKLGPVTADLSADLLPGLAGGVFVG